MLNLAKSKLTFYSRLPSTVVSPALAFPSHNHNRHFNAPARQRSLLDRRGHRVLHHNPGLVDLPHSAEQPNPSGVGPAQLLVSILVVVHLLLFWTQRAGVFATRVRLALAQKVAKMAALETERDERGSGRQPRMKKSILVTLDFRVRVESSLNPKRYSSRSFREYHNVGTSLVEVIRRIVFRWIRNKVQAWSILLCLLFGFIEADLSIPTVGEFGVFLHCSSGRATLVQITWKMRMKNRLSKAH